MLLLLLTACAPDITAPSPGVTTLVTDPEVERLGGDEDPVFSQSKVHTLEITLSDESYDTLGEETEAYSSDPVYVVGDIEWDGLRVPDVGVRIKGRWGTWRPLDEKPSFKVDFNRYVDGQRFMGLESLTVNNLIVDCSYLREATAYPVYEAMGIPAPRVSYVNVQVNGEPYGLYLNVESPDDRFLNRHFADPSGPLYDADYILWGDGSYTILDFYAQLIGYMELEEGEDPDRAALTAIVAALDSAQGPLYEATDALIDWDHHQRLVAAEMWVGQVDGYSMNRNNYLVYVDPLDGRGRTLPWDHDYSFIHARDWGFSWTNPQGRLTNACLNDAACRADQLAAFERVIDEVEALGLQAHNDELIELLGPHIDADRRRDCRRSDVRSYQSSLAMWLEERSGELRQTWGI